MQDKFWTPELWCEFLNSNPGLPPTFQNEVNLFKSSKSPKKEWEIVAFRYLPNGNIISDMGTVGALCAEAGSDDYTIHSVRRLSDDWTVSVKDRVKTMGGETGTIKSFDATGHILFEDISGLEHVTTIQKLPQPILTTVDGVGIFEMEHFWCLKHGFPDMLNPYTACEQTPEWFAAEKGYQIFSTKDAMNNWLAENKPLLSLNDVKKVWNKQFIQFPLDLLGELTAIVKEKLNQ